jgi:hypothetical protein
MLSLKGLIRLGQPFFVVGFGYVISNTGNHLSAFVFFS